MVRGENEEAAALVLGRLLQGVRFRSGLHFFLFRLLWVLSSEVAVQFRDPPLIRRTTRRTHFRL